MNVEKLQDIAAFVVKYAKERGATDCSVAISTSTNVDTGIRLGSVENLQGSDSRGLTFRAFVGKRVATSHSTDLTRNGLRRLVRDTIAMAEVLEPDEYAGLPEPGQFETNFAELSLMDNSLANLTNADRIGMALASEKAAMAVDQITNSEGSTFASGSRAYVYANSRGFVGGYAGTSCYIYTSVVAGEGKGMKIGGDYSQGRFLDQLLSPEAIGASAAQKAIEQMGAKKVKSQNVPVIYDRRMAARLLGQFVSAAAGAHVYRESSFLAGKIYETVAADIVNISDDGHIARASGSRPFDSEGLPTRFRSIVKNGKLAAYLIDSYAGRKLGIDPNGGGTSNLFIEAGASTPEEIIGSVENGLYLTGVSGPGFNVTSGDYSMGAKGIWIQDGKLAFPVAEITVAGNILDMMQSIEMIGNDLLHDSSTAAPTLKIGKMMVAGS